MAEDLLFTVEGDLDLINDDLGFTSGDDSIRQAISMRLQFLYGEWFLSTAEGVPYTQILFEPGITDDDFREAMFAEVSKVDGVESIDNIGVDRNGKTRDITITIEVNQSISLEVVL